MADVMLTFAYLHCPHRFPGTLLFYPPPLSLRGIQVVEYAIGVPSLTMGDSSPSVATDMDITSWRVPLGVTAGICPFNFPAMIPLWMFPMVSAMTC